MSRCQVWWCRRPATTCIAMSPNAFRSMAVCQPCANRMSGRTRMRSRRWWAAQAAALTVSVALAFALMLLPERVLNLVLGAMMIAVLILWLGLRRLGKWGAQFGHAAAWIMDALASGGPMHGWGIRTAVQAKTDVELPLTVIYSALRRLMDAGLVEFAGLAEGEDGRRARNLYGLTDAGRESIAPAPDVTP